jgi:RNA polymerase sigma-70 factor, ECF subfamily
MNQLEIFNQYRSLLFAIAYRMLGSIADGEDMVQEAWLRWQNVKEEVRSPKAYLSALVTRLCINYLQSARVRREQYVGTWLPEPLVTESPLDRAELAESLSMGFLLLLECLSPTERAVFLLREVFSYDYAAIAIIVNKSVPNCRQMVRRTRQHLALCRPTISPSPQQQEQLIEQLLTLWNRGDVEGLVALMAEDITASSDGGGQAIAARKPIQGHLKVARYLVALRRSRFLPSLTSQIAQINGQIGVMNFADDKLHSVMSFEFNRDRIYRIYSVLNPDKLKVLAKKSWL